MLLDTGPCRGNDSNHQIDGVKDGFTKIEDGVVKGYKSIEDGAVTGFNTVNDWFISKLFQRKGETLEECKARLKANAENAGRPQ